jgi:hypothetical protein
MRASGTAQAWKPASVVKAAQAAAFAGRQRERLVDDALRYRIGRRGGDGGEQQGERERAGCTGRTTDRHGSTST